MLLFYLILINGCLAYMSRSAIYCHDLDSLLLSEETTMYECSENGNFIIHTNALNYSIPSMTKHMDCGWMEIKPGLLHQKPSVLEPVSSCLSQTQGAGGTKSVTNTDALYFVLSGTLRIPLLSALFLQFGATPGAGLRVRLSRIMEYGCTAAAGQTVQIVQTRDEYLLKDWEFRPISEDQHENRPLVYGLWVHLPDVEATEETETIACVTDPDRIQCRP
ncbi:hypothetical protein PUMCH_003972 [Australozyma saopauloensis]|uniref:Uncharacterized protein n=1 Tax=Australozyma saopauloensis TaxID=291208 RepID=A0AAX4HE41_9ASCO|nr:hypothetical protein PUMCH_003972 [[Candida] saopauloensis]